MPETTYSTNPAAWMADWVITPHNFLSTPATSWIVFSGDDDDADDLGDAVESEAIFARDGGDGLTTYGSYRAKRGIK